MKRRDFFKKILWTPLITPALISSSSDAGPLQLYVIADTPHLFLPLLLRELNPFQRIKARTFAFFNDHPQAKEIKGILHRDGWRPASRASAAELSLSFHILSQPSSPSFTLIKNRRIWDIRSRRLLSLWKEMKTCPPSSFLTVLALQQTATSIQPGHFLSIIIKGRKKERLSLDHDIISSFRTERGQVILTVEKGKAWISSSSCRHKICCSVPPVSLSGERIICAPNHFLLEISGSSSVDTSIG